MMAKSRRFIKKVGNEISPAVSFAKRQVVERVGNWYIVHVAGEDSALQVYYKSETSIVPAGSHRYFFTVDAAKAWIEDQR